MRAKAPGIDMSRYSKPANLPGFWLSDVICSPGGESSQRWRYGRGSQKVPIKQGGSCGAPVELLQRLRPGLSNATHATLLSSRVRPRTALKSARVATADVNTGRVAEPALNERLLGASRLLTKGTLRLPDRPRPLIRSSAAIDTQTQGIGSEALKPVASPLPEPCLPVSRSQRCLDLGMSIPNRRWRHVGRNVL